MRLISSMDIVEHLAGCAVRLHPYHAPDGLFDFVQALLTKCRADFKDGCDPLPMRWFASYQELLGWLSDSFMGNDTLKSWNTPRSGHAQQIVFSSRYGGPGPVDDFIDIDALWMNVARGTWDAAAEFERHITAQATFVTPA